MSKVIVDQIQKNGGTTFTLPSADGSSANQPLVTNGSGILAFSPLSMPAADGTANKPLVSDGAGQLGFNPNILPVSQGTAGQYLISGGAAAATWQAASAGSFFKAYDFNASSATAVVIKYSDIDASLTKDNVAGMTLHLYGVSSSSEAYFSIRGLDSSDNPITTGYYGYTHFGLRGQGSQSQGISHNSNDGRFWFPIYTTASSTGYSYGSGMTGTINIYHGPESNSFSRSPECHFNIQYQQGTSNNHPNIEHGGWNNYATQQTSPEWTNGIYWYITSGNFNAGRLVVEAHKR